MEEEPAGTAWEAGPEEEHSTVPGEDRIDPGADRSSASRRKTRWLASEGFGILPRRANRYKRGN